MLRLLLPFMAILFPLMVFSQNPWINEIHYDNTGADVGEGAEIAGPAGTDLSCYQLIAYNGAGGASYITLPLTGTITDEGCGYGAIWFPMAGLQNGSPDGIALYNTCTSTLVVGQFLSYEGSFAATDVPVSPAVSVDIGVVEPSTTAVGESLQLTGSGNSYASFAWNAPALASPGTLNTGQTISPCITTGLVTGAPFTVDCTAPTTDAGSVAFTSSGTFGGGNIYSVQLSDASGSFLSPTVIGTLASTANSGSINFTIPAATPTGAGYLVRVVSDNPISTGSASAAFTITQTTPCVPQTPTTPGLIINEWSNGPTGNQEYYEFVVAGQCGQTVDIRGYILDDNNGTFTNPADYPGTASGIADGHFRFSYAAQWATIPVGSLIVIYNRDDPNPAVPADDPTDANTDSLYVVPHDNALFERCLAFPAPTSPDSTYSPCTYAVSPLTGWGPLSLRNDGDAIQVRTPDGTYYHGVSYGGTEMTGGPHGLKLFTGGGGARVGWFSDGNFFDISNWSSGTLAGNETPGVPNNAANAAWLVAMRDVTSLTCPIVLLPIELTDFDGEKLEDGNLLRWETQSEHNSSYFTLERSVDAKQWDVINMQPASGNSQNLLTYSFIDRGFTSGTVNYYRLAQTDIDGEVENFGEIVSIDNRVQLVNLMKIVNLLGQEINENAVGVQIHVFSDGTTTKYLKQ